MAKFLKQTGVCPDGTPVMAGVFVLVDTHGVPLTTAVELLQGKGVMPDWLDFYQSALRVGWKPVGILSKMDEAVLDVYGTVFRDAWRIRLFECLNALGIPVPG